MLSLVQELFTKWKKKRRKKRKFLTLTTATNIAQPQTEELGEARLPLKLPHVVNVDEINDATLMRKSLCRQLCNERFELWKSGLKCLKILFSDSKKICARCAERLKTSLKIKVSRILAVCTSLRRTTYYVTKLLLIGVD